MNASLIWASIRRGFTHLTDARGRDTRAQYWPYALLLIAVQIVALGALSVWLVVTMVSEAMAMPHEGGDAGATEAAVMQHMAGSMFDVIIGSAVLGLVVTLLLLTATTRRLHDRGWSGWWLLGPLAGQLAGLFSSWHEREEMAALIANAATDPAVMERMPADVLGTVISLATWGFAALLLIQLVQEGTPGDNRYGPATAAPPPSP